MHIFCLIVTSVVPDDPGAVHVHVQGDVQDLPDEKDVLIPAIGRVVVPAAVLAAENAKPTILLHVLLEDR